MKAAYLVSFKDANPDTTHAWRYPHLGPTTRMCFPLGGAGVHEKPAGPRRLQVTDPVVLSVFTDFV